MIGTIHSGLWPRANHITLSHTAPERRLWRADFSIGRSRYISAICIIHTVGIRAPPYIGGGLGRQPSVYPVIPRSLRSCLARMAIWGGRHTGRSGTVSTLRYRRQLERWPIVAERVGAMIISLRRVYERHLCSP